METWVTHDGRNIVYKLTPVEAENLAELLENTKISRDGMAWINDSKRIREAIKELEEWKANRKIQGRKFQDVESPYL